MISTAIERDGCPVLTTGALQGHWIFMAACGRPLSAACLGDITFQVHDCARHELLNETNRNEVVTDTLAWLCART